MKALQPTFMACGLLLLLQPAFSAAPPEGYVIQWGCNGALDAVTPAKVVASNAVTISAGDSHGLAVRGDGTVVGWGGNTLGSATGTPTTNAPYTSSGQVFTEGRLLSNVMSIVAARNFSLALKKDRTVATWGENYLPPGLSNIVAMSAGWNTSWALRDDGTIVGWVSSSSWSNYGQLIPVEGLSNVVALAFGPGGSNWRGIALKGDGTVGHWGNESTHKDATPPDGLSNVVAVAAGANHSLALRNDGTVVGWGFNRFGQATGIPETNAPSISAGQEYTSATVPPFPSIQTSRRSSSST